MILRLLLFALATLLVGPASALEQVTLQLKWKHQFQFAGYYAALEQGYYRQAGLDVVLREADSNNSDPVAAVLDGRADYGIGASDLVLERARGKPLVALAVIIQHSPLVLLTRADLDTAQDLKDKRVMLLPSETELFAYLAREGLARSQIKEVPHSFQWVDLIEGRVDALSGYSSDETFDLKASRFHFNQFSPRSLGIDFYGDTLFTSEAKLQARPLQVAAFRQASLDGWKYALEHPDEIIDLIQKRYSSRHSRAHLEFEAAELKRLMAADLVEIGQMKPGRWQHIAEVYQELGMIPTDYSLEGFLYDPTPPKAPGWMMPALLAFATLLLAMTIAVGYFAQLNRRLHQALAQRDEALRQSQESEEHYRLIADNSDDVIWLLDIDSRRFTYVSPSVHRLRGWTAEEVMAQSLDAALTPASATIISARLQEGMAGLARGDRSAQVSMTEVDQPHKDGRIIPTEVSTTLLTDAAGRVTRVLGVSRNITERRKLEAALRDNEERLRLALESTGDSVWDWNIQDGTAHYSDSWKSVLGYGPNELKNTVEAFFALVHPDDLPRVREELERHWRGETPNYRCEFRMQAKQDDWHWILGRGMVWTRSSEGAPLRMLGTHLDITERKLAEFAISQANTRLQAQLEEIQTLQARLADLAVRDGLTGLFNRRYLDETLEREVARARRDGHPLSVIMFDLDLFKNLNDSYGHRAGDHILKAVADILRTDTRAEDVACRYGGEEFLIVLPGMALDHACQRAETWRARFEASNFSFGNFTLHVTGSFGVAGYPDHGKTPDELTHAADSALYQAKHLGRNRVEFYGGEPIAFVTKLQ
ncbi:diguanylate cyclase [Denitratisoma oestradiolicum]|uniref:Diguanylate cyclase with PAS/PAC sensor n=1 Tax=Denitratisoma oestradiolicum TaxID=311182 RepID=A0A6S6Y0X7_9PROT|nr:diguanylate cyclase [Denitratisoma oestradiolicum]TWO81947.1 hypothetical protein CBW56_00420 [Denitratisoma oestradiolicum]CAB1368849.1 Diguanylate cyclase with PAS/PAC sensor [Denitratisoma oestradiolicum]